MVLEGDALILILFTLLLGLGALSSMSETALFSLNAGQSARLRAELPQSKVIFRKPREMLVSLLLVNIAVNLLVQNVASEVFAEQEGGWMLTVGLPLVLTLLFSELLPKVIAMSYNEKVARVLTPYASFLLKVLARVVPFIATSASIVARYLFFFVTEPSVLKSEELVKFLTSSSSIKRQTDNSDIGLTLFEGSLLGGLVALQEAKVEDLMRPRSEIIYYDLQQPISELFERFHQRQCSQIPVCNGGLDQIEGVLYALDLVQNDIPLTKENVRQLMKKPVFLPQSSPAVTVLQHVEKDQEDLLLAVNEYGVISGLLTIEDLLEAVVGDIKDARDQSDFMTEMGHGRYITSAQVELEAVFPKLGLETPKSSMNTLGGFLCQLFGDIPESGALISYENVDFRILEATKRKVLKVYINDLLFFDKKGGG